MNGLTPDYAINESEILAVKLDLIRRQSMSAYIANFVNSFVYLFFAWRESWRPVVIVWCVGLNLLTFARVLAGRRQSAGLGTAHTQLFYRHWFFQVGSLLSGGFWGVLGWLYFDSQTVVAQTGALFLLAGMVSGAAGAYSTSLGVYYAFIFPALMPLIFRALYLDHSVNLVIAGVATLYLGLMIRLGQNANRTIRDTIVLSKQNEALKAEQRATSRLIANVSHELRTPLAAIEGYIDLLHGESGFGGKSCDYLSMIRKSSDHLLAIVDELLDYSRLNAGKVEPVSKWFSPLAEVNDAIRLLTSQNTKGLAFEVHVPDPVPATAYSDPKIFRQILLNLLTNALKYTQKGKIDITVREQVRGLGHFLVVDVADTGAGIEPGLEARLFQPFTRGADASTQRQQGVGLGLALSKELAHLVGGDLILKETAPGRGSIFSFSVDIGGNTENEEFKGLSVMVVDDSRELVELMKILLERKGMKVETSASGEEALEKLRRSNFDLILMDIWLPGIDGYETIRRMRAAGHAKPVLALTAHSSEEHRQRSLREGFSGFFKKPVDVEAVFRWLQDWQSRKPAPPPGAPQPAPK